MMKDIDSNTRVEPQPKSSTGPIVMLLLLCVAGAGSVYWLHEKDRQESAEVLLELTRQNPEERAVLAAAVDAAKVKAGSLRFDRTKNETLAAIEVVEQEFQARIELASNLRGEALALLQDRIATLPALREALLKAEALAAQIPMESQATETKTRLAAIFEEQRQSILAEEARRAEEERRRQELEQAAIQLEAERQANIERRRMTEAQAALEAERRRPAATAVAFSPPAPESSDCCCKAKVDVGFLLPKWEYQYKRLEKNKCAKPGFFDAHREGWCVPDAYCH